jgi:hypothetical protein
VIALRLPGAALFVAAIAARAQDTSATRLADRRCDSIVAATRADTVPRGLFLGLRRADGGDIGADQAIDMLLVVGASFAPPTPFRLTVFSGPIVTPGLRRLSPDTTPVRRAPTLVGVYRMTSDSYGVVTALETTRASLMPGFDSAAKAAITSASEIKGLFAPRDGTLSATVDFRFSTDSVGGPGWTVRRLLTTVFPRMPVTDVVLQPQMGSVELPQSERREGVPASTVLRFVVDRTGEPIVETLEVVRGASIELVRGALSVLAKQRFTPARISGCSVAQLVEFPFVLPPLSPSGAPPSDDVRDRY